MIDHQPKVSIITPVFNAAELLPNCLLSLKNQTYENTELIFVNDCSTDKSLELLEAFAQEMPESGVKILSHSVNSGVAATRNTGLENATGDYIYYVDADDAIEPVAVELLVSAAEEDASDIVGCNWYLSFQKNERRMNQPAFYSPQDAIEKLMSGTMRWNLWLFLVKRELYENNHFRFLPGQNMGEDMTMMIKLFTVAKKVNFIDVPLYHYLQINTNSLTHTYSEKHIAEVTANVKDVEHFMMGSESHFSEFDKSTWLSFLKLNIKLPLLISDKMENYERWIDWFPESNIYAFANKRLPQRTRFLQWMAAKRQFWFLKLYYQVVIKTMYGVIYR